MVILTEFIRIKNVIAWSAVSFSGFILGLYSLNFSSYITPLFVFIITTFFIMSFTFAINNYYDTATDKENPRRRNINAIASGKISKRTGIVLNIIFVIISLFFSIIYKFEAFLFCTFLLFLGWAYSAPPLRIKGRPVLDVIWHFLGFFSYIIWGSLIAGSIGFISIMFAFSVGIWSSVGQIGNHISDYSFDKESGTKTFAVWIGLDKAKITISILTLFHLVLLVPLVIFYTLSYVFTIIFFIDITIIGFLILKPKIGVFPNKRCFIYFFTIIIGGAVYGSVMIYQIMLLLGLATINILQLSGVP